MTAQPLRLRFTILVLVLAAILASFALFMFLESKKEERQNELYLSRNLVAEHLSNAAGTQAIERGVGNTIIGGNHNLIGLFRSLGAEGDADVGKAEKNIERLREQGFSSFDFENKVTSWQASSAAVRQRRAGVEDGSITSKEWLPLATINIMNEFDLHDLVFTPVNQSEAILYYNTMLRPNIATLAEFAGLERALIGNTLASGGDIEGYKILSLERFRSRVDHAIRKIKLIKSYAATSPRLADAINKFEDTFLGLYEDLRNDIYRISAEKSKELDTGRRQLVKLRAEIERSFISPIRELKSLTGNIHMKELVTRMIKGETPDFSRLRNVFEDLNEVHHEYSQVRYIDAFGKERVRVDLIDGRYHFVPDEFLQNKSNRYYFLKSADLPQGQVYISPLDLNIERGKIERPFMPMLRFSAPVIAGAQRHGIVVLNFFANQFLNSLPDDIILVDENGFYLHHPAPEKEWGMMPSLGRDGFNIKHDIPEVGERLLSQEPKKIITSDSIYITEPIHFTSAGQDKFWIIIKKTTLPSYPLNSSEWISRATEAIDTALAISTIVGKLAAEVVQQREKTTKNTTALSVALAIVVVLTLLSVGFYFISVGRRMKLITTGLNRLAEGDISNRINLRGEGWTDASQAVQKDEIDAIAIRVNQMADKLEDSISSLRESRSDLELKVADRTKEYQLAREEAEEANKAKSEFLASMSHELRTPLNAVLGFAQMLQFDPKNVLSPAQNVHVESILEGGNHLLELVNEILDLAKIEVGQFDLSLEEVNANAAVADCVALTIPLGEPRDITIIDQFNGRSLSLLFTDHLRFKQILFNLLSNAIKYNKDGGTVTVSAGETDNGFLRISVTDTGVGIAKEDYESVFRLFHRLGADPMIAREGTGIGLTVTKLLVERMAGRIDFESEEGIGSTFWIELPLASNEEVIIWNSTLRVGVDAIDKDHQTLASLLNRVTHGSVDEGVLDQAVEELIDYTQYHFQREEAVMEVCVYPDLEAHRGRHKDIVIQANVLANALRKEHDPETLYRLRKFLRDWLFGHIIKVDTDLARFAKGKDKDIRKALENLE
ncbi:MAG: bacteriohemerythrin [Rhodospirillales bacterium]|nr:bacteriohemerythrin [Rhodospirillales bacterium]